MKRIVVRIREEQSKEVLQKEQQQCLKDIFHNLANIQTTIVRHTGELIHCDESLGGNHIRESDKGDQLLLTIDGCKKTIDIRLEKLKELHIPLDVKKAKSYTDWIYKDFPPSKIYSIRANIFNKETEFDEISDMAEKRKVYQSCIDYCEVIRKINEVFQKHNEIKDVEKINTMMTYEEWGKSLTEKIAESQSIKTVQLPQSVWKPSIAIGTEIQFLDSDGEKTWTGIVSDMIPSSEETIYTASKVGI